MSTPTKRPAPGDVAPAAKRQRLNIDPGAVAVFECVPGDRLEKAIKYALRVPGVKEAGLTTISIDPGARCQRNSGSLDGPDCKTTKMSSGSVNKNLLSSVEKGLSPHKQGLRLLPAWRRKIGPSREEEPATSMIHWMHATLGSNLAGAGESVKNVFLLFTLNVLAALGYHSADRPTM